MRRFAFAALLVATVMLAAPASAQTADVLKPCTSTAGAVVVTPAGLKSDIATPSLPLYGDSTTRDFILDLAGQPLTDNKAIVEIVMTWDIPVEDYDLNMLDAGGSTLAESAGIQPLDDGEAVSGEVGHCKRFSAEALNWTAAGLSKLSLSLSVS
jgi:hypothetical protein